jgi:hypothetical protein
MKYAVIYIKSHKEWFRQSKIDSGGYTWMAWHGDLILRFQNKEKVI